jgi:hypothetical protein
VHKASFGHYVLRIEEGQLVYTMSEANSSLKLPSKPEGQCAVNLGSMQRHASATKHNDPKAFIAETALEL